MKMCKHDNTQRGEALAYTGVSFMGDRRATGGVQYLRTCLDCGATRQELANGQWEDQGEWSVSLERRVSEVVRDWARWRNISEEQVNDLLGRLHPIIGRLAA